MGKDGKKMGYQYIFRKNLQDTLEFQKKNFAGSIKQSLKRGKGEGVTDWVKIKR